MPSSWPDDCLENMGHGDPVFIVFFGYHSSKI
jgi:hypothetical protein